jgi:hypothetical protein
MNDLDSDEKERQTSYSPLESSQLELLDRELTRIESKMQAERATFERLWALIFLVIGGGIAASSADWASVVIPFLPVAVLFLGLLWAISSREHQALGGYKQHLEETLNRSVNQNLVIWESHLAPRIDQTKRTPQLMYVVVILLWLILWAMAIKSATGFTRYFVCFLVLPSFGALGIALKEANEARAQVLLAARDYGSEPFSVFGPNESESVSTKAKRKLLALWPFGKRHLDP